MNLTEALLKVFNRYSYMVKRYPKAAQKRRIRAKWRNRFGPSMADAIAEDMTTDGFVPERTPSPYDDEFVITFL
jgi:hypothetical protein